MSEVFRASAQYNDWTGTAAADEAGQRDLHKLLRNRNLIEENEFLVGVSIFVGENHRGKVQDPFVHCYVVEGNQFETVQQALLNAPEPLKLREISLELSLVEAIGLFKRFSVNLSWKGMKLNGREFVTSN